MASHLNRHLTFDEKNLPLACLVPSFQRQRVHAAAKWRSTKLAGNQALYHLKKAATKLNPVKQKGSDTGYCKPCRKGLSESSS